VPAEFDGRAKLETLELFNDLEKEFSRMLLRG
jgi:hypothetical protein